VDYKIHYDLSWFKPLLSGNSPMSSGLILKMNRGYKGKNGSIFPCLRGRVPFIARAGGLVSMVQLLYNQG
jgi:hypothetical protein